jgi:hypothetical protein
MVSRPRPRCAVRLRHFLSFRWVRTAERVFFDVKFPGRKRPTLRLFSRSELSWFLSRRALRDEESMCGSTLMACIVFVSRVFAPAPGSVAQTNGAGRWSPDLAPVRLPIVVRKFDSASNGPPHPKNDVLPEKDLPPRVVVGLNVSVNTGEKIKKLPGLDSNQE